MEVISEELKQILEEYLYIFEYLNQEQLTIFYNEIVLYLQNRTKLETFEANLKETTNLLQVFGLNPIEIITCIFNWPSIIHADKQELYKKYLILSKPVRGGVSNIDRKELLIHHSKDFMIGFDLLYARIEFFMSEASKDVIRKDCITRRKLFKTTSKEFEISYGITKDNLLEKFPFDEEELEEIKKYDMNKDIVEKYEVKDEKNGWTM